VSERDDKHAKDYRELSGEEGKKKIAERVKEIRIAMMSTLDDGGEIHSRPMATQDVPFDGTLWFLTRATSAKMGDLQRHRNVTLDYADPGDSKYITLRRTAAEVKDRAKIKELWSPMYKAWFPEGRTILKLPCCASTLPRAISGRPTAAR